MRSWFGKLGWALVGIGCGAAPDATAPEEVVQGAPEASLEPEGTVRLRLRDGSILEAPYFADGDLARVGDLGFPLEEVRRRSRERAAGVIDLDHRWPGGVVPFLFDPAQFPSGLTDLVPQPSWNKTPCEGSTLPTGSLYPTIGQACQAVQSTLAGMFSWTQEVPGITFVESDETEADWIVVTAALDAFSSELGASGNYNLWNLDPAIEGHVGPCAGTDQLAINLGNSGTARHELGHALGFWHEQGRPDRDDFLIHDGSCDYLFADVNNWKASGADFESMGPFDFRSVMLYDSYSFVRHPRTETPPDSVVPVGSGSNARLEFGVDTHMGMAVQQPAFGSWKVTLVPAEVLDADVDEFTVSGVFTNATTGGLVVQARLSDLGLESVTAAALNQTNWEVRSYDEDGHEQVDASCPALTRFGTDVFTVSDPPATFGDNSRLSAGDVSAAFHFYGASHDDGSPAEADDRFGQALVHGDFDGDGLVDLAVGVPGDDGGEGAVALYRGVYEANTTGRIEHLPWRLLEGYEVWDLAVGDFDGDGFQDLVVGHAGSDQKGRVDVLLGRDANDFTEPRWLAFTGFSDLATPPSMPAGWADHPGARVGWSLAVGDLDDDGLDDLVIGAPGAAAWQPAKRPASLPITTLWNPAPYATTGAALVYLGSDGGDPLVPWDGALDAYDSSATGSHRDSAFGHDVDIGDYDGDGCDDVAVGAPFGFRVRSVPGGSFPRYETDGDHAGAGVRTGTVYLFQGRRDSWNQCFGTSDPLRFSRHVSTHQQGSEYGFAVTSGRLLGAAEDLVVGAPGAFETQPPYTDRPGAAYRYAATASLLTTNAPPLLVASATFTESQHAVCDDDGDRFGQTLAIGRLATTDPFDTLAIGAPSRDALCLGSLPPEVGHGGVFLRRKSGAVLAPLDVLELLGPVPHDTDALGAAIAFRPLGTLEVTTASLEPVSQLGLTLGAPGEEGLTTGVAGGVVRVMEPSPGGIHEVQAIEQH